ncbi:MAG: LL-diaminopimelate aminotransferase [Steroidobacteraceae bacterium]|nr:LL-diaminopimelate aminotransferase [Steroidobacteraceae bacterium]
MNPRIAALHAYPFEKLAALTEGCRPPAQLAHIAMSIGEPKHEPPAFVLDALRAALGELGRYPSTVGLPALRAAAARWLERRFALGAGAVDEGTMVLPVNGTREALFAFVQAAIDPRRPALVAMPNPFYQIYEGAALLAGATPHYLNTTAASGFMPDLDAVPAHVWRDVQILFLCSPGNPTGAVLPRAYLEHALALAERHDFVIASDECYSDLWLDEARPPPSLLEAARGAGRDRFERCIVFHSLSKRSSVPGLRSGFVAGDPALIRDFLRYRTYHGCAIPVPTQLASIAAWNDDAHAAVNRALYREKFARAVPLLAPVLDVSAPAGGFYLWPDVRGDDTVFTRELLAAQNITILPGSFLAREAHGMNPGTGRVRISLVAGVAECVEAAGRIRAFLDR